MNTETQQPVMQAPPSQQRSILDQIRDDHELVARLSITAQELEALSKCALLGTLTCKEDMLFILRQIREATRPGPEPLATHNPSASSASTTSTASAPPMRAADILRKIRLLSMVKTENGASAAEADNAQRLARTLMDRYSIKTVEERPAAAQQRPAAKLTWVYWQELFNEFCLQFGYLGYRGSATIGHDRTVYIKLNTGQWSVEKRSKDGGTQIVARDIGLETMRKYLSAHARTYSFLSNRRSGS
jgi:Protein of unknown function (DUF2786)